MSGSIRTTRPDQSSSRRRTAVCTPAWPAPMMRIDDSVMSRTSFPLKSIPLHSPGLLPSSQL
ncbi:hypothetical protein ACFFX0_20165 [Citricoccus parietis]|uniref:Uncharacterized protein n=1 Tax=Citricoccus parietis TaxID=592307 RepID=A0ABV5G374_9MICC